MTRALDQPQFGSPICRGDEIARVGRGHFDVVAAVSNQADAAGATWRSRPLDRSPGCRDRGRGATADRCRFRPPRRSAPRDVSPRATGTTEPDGRARQTSRPPVRGRRWPQPPRPGRHQSRSPRVTREVRPRPLGPGSWPGPLATWWVKTCRYFPRPPTACPSPPANPTRSPRARPVPARVRPPGDPCPSVEADHAPGRGRDRRPVAHWSSRSADRESTCRS